MVPNPRAAMIAPPGKGCRSRPPPSEEHTTSPHGRNPSSSPSGKAASEEELLTALRSGVARSPAPPLSSEERLSQEQPEGRASPTAMTRTLAAAEYPERHRPQARRFRDAPIIPAVMPRTYRW